MLLDELKLKQYELDESDEVFSRRLGLSRIHWTKIRSGERRLTNSTLIRIARKNPELKAKIIKELGLSNEVR